MRRLLALALVMSAPVLAQEQGAPDAPLAYAQLTDPAQEAEAKALMETIRCVQCQGQTIADSDAPIAATMRHEIREQIGAGKSPDQVKHWLIDRYGEWISYDPVLTATTAPLYLVPLALFIIGGFMAWRRFSGPKPVSEGPVSEEDSA